ncbi:MAG: flavocytochrome c [Syntrophales bacterium]|nr:flavocytochrome c [Syntrophales bacterium]MDD4338708.1 flavocytochrome c [Syntrophales bacterium]HOG08074.1 flavocytochrome c [Syntrophales bacterium]HPB69898.1 flavocytochrome c [Syntrophales bacterium]HQN25072.1 flavocytochrome c [Syntrophales bacterium]
MSEASKRAASVSRRQFMKTVGGAAAVAGMAVGGVGLGGQALAAPGKMPKKWDETYDVIVIGSGFAGLTAAIEARNGGALVTVIEKMVVPGGNSIINGGDFAAAGNKLQKEQGVQDSAELMLKDMLKAGSYLNHPELAKLVADGSNAALEWCQQYVGAQFARLNFHGGHSVKRAVQTVNASGSELVNKMLAKAKELGIGVQTRTKLVRLVLNDAGRIVGIEVRKGYRFPNEASGKAAFLKARRAVVLGSGGFSQDVKLRQVHDPRLNDKFDSTNQPGATGEALLAACQVGAMDVQMDWIQLGPWTSPDEKGFGLVPLFCERLVGYAPMVDPATGKRFIKETGDRKVRADAIILLGHPVLIFGDAYAVPKQVFSNALEKGLASGAIRKFDSLETLAQHYNIPRAALLEEVARWNGYVEKKKDPQFDCMIFPDAKPTVMPPFYAARLWPRVHHTMGGLVIDTNAQVTGFNMKPVPGLYAAGEVTGGVHGAVRLGSVAMADCVVFGRIAGRNAAAEKPWS